MSELIDELQAQIDALGATDEEIDVDHDPTNGRWLEKEFADALERWGYQTARNAHIFGLETDVVARRARLRDEPDDYIVAECKDWHTTLVGREAVGSISHRALLARAMPVLVVAWGVTTPAWCLAQLLDVRIVAIDDLFKESLPPLTEHRPPRGTFRTRREPRVSELRGDMPQLLKRRSDRDIEAPVFYTGKRGPLLRARSRWQRRVRERLRQRLRLRLIAPSKPITGWHLPGDRYPDVRLSQTDVVPCT